MSLQLDGEIAITANGQTLTGWQNVRITRGIEHFPSDFEVVTTEKYPGTTQEIVIRPQTPCVVTVGGEVIITGYIDEYDTTITPRDHTVRISGRSKCMDLMDCSAFFGDLKMQMTNATAIDVIRQICDQYGIQVTDNTQGRASAAHFPFALNRGESPLEIIDRLARWHGFMFHDLPNGNLMLTIAGENSMGSGITMGGDKANVEIGNFRWNLANVMSDYYVWRQSYLDLLALGAAPISQHVTDNYMQGIGRKRVFYILCEQIINGDNFDLLRANWEANHREGTGQTITATIDRWRDSGGQLWAPNYYITVNTPQLKIPPIDGGWVIAAVTFTKDASGQHAELVLNPKYTFDPQPEQQPVGELAPLAGNADPNANANNPAQNPNVLGQPVPAQGPQITNPITTETLPDGSFFTKDAAGNIIDFTAAP